VTGLTDREPYAAYLLGELSAEEQLRLEQEYFTDNAAWERLLAVEEELACDFVEDRLPAGRRERFSETIGATERGRENVQFARDLMTTLNAAERLQARSQYQWWAAAAALLLAALTGWLAFRVGSLSSELAAVRRDATAQQARNLQPAAAAPPAQIVEVAFLLTPGRSRGDSTPVRLELAASATQVRLELAPPPGADPGDYVVAIHSASGAEIFSHVGAQSGTVWSVAAPAALFPPGSYEVTVRRVSSGEQQADLASYPFRLTRR
jgi:hypothetical protein